MKPPSRRAYVDGRRPCGAGFVLPEVEKNVRQGMTDFPRRLQRSRMVAIGPDSTAPFDDVVVRSREPNGQARHPARQRHAIIGFDDQVYMVALHRKVHHTRPRSRGGTERAAKSVEDALRSHAWQAGTTTHRDVNWMAAMVWGPSLVGDASAPAGAPTLSTNGECEVELPHAETETDTSRYRRRTYKYRNSISDCHACRDSFLK
jgi:hypothetical protein